MGIQKILLITRTLNGSNRSTFELVPKNGRKFFLLYKLQAIYIFISVGVLSHFMNKPQALHLEATKREIGTLKVQQIMAHSFEKEDRKSLRVSLMLIRLATKKTEDQLLTIYFVLGLVQSFGAVCDNQWLLRALQKRSTDLWHKEQRILHG